jgi:hypothetical protein
MPTLNPELDQMLRLFYLVIRADVGRVMTHSVVKALLDSEGARHSFFEIPCGGHQRAFQRLVLQDFAKRTFPTQNLVLRRLI